MTEVAERDGYGYREVVPGTRVRVAVFAGQEIPPDLVDLEDADADVDANVAKASTSKATGRRRSKRSE
jgi:hypothetical protein